MAMASLKRRARVRANGLSRNLCARRRKVEAYRGRAGDPIRVGGAKTCCLGVNDKRPQDAIRTRLAPATLVIGGFRAYLQPIDLAGQLGRFASFATGAHVSATLQIDETGKMAAMIARHNPRAYR